MSQLSPSEKKGILIVSAVILVGFIIQYFQPHFIHKELYDYSVQDSIFRVISTSQLKVSEADSSIEETAYKADVAAEKYPRKEKDLKQKININSAGQKELEKLPRIGPSTAKNIIEYRTEHGPYKNFDDLKKVKRIGPKTVELLKPHVIFNNPE